MEQGRIRNKQGLYDWLKMAKLPYDNFIIIFIINPKNSLYNSKKKWRTTQIPLNLIIDLDIEIMLHWHSA